MIALLLVLSTCVYQRIIFSLRFLAVKWWSAKPFKCDFLWSLKMCLKLPEIEEKTNLIRRRRRRNHLKLFPSQSFRRIIVLLFKTLIPVHKLTKWWILSVLLLPVKFNWQLVGTVQPPINWNRPFPSWTPMNEQPFSIDDATRENKSNFLEPH